jgi:AraC family transcriptional regulator
METYVEQPSASMTTATELASRWLHQVIALVDSAVRLLPPTGLAAQDALLVAASLLRQQLDPAANEEIAGARGRLLSWQAHKVRDYIDGHITEPMPVCELSAVLQLSEAHFARSFKLTFGESPHAYVIRRRVEFAKDYMLHSDATLIEIALQCGYADQAHLCKQFRAATGHTPSTWRRDRRMHSTLDAPLGSG